ncbi:MAG: hypothetical protein H0Z25_02540 [Kosmotoga sp.]|uniref:hypothetical protein n=1 Tax=Kosmotoga sp. TaxID=1955248 RepID=UPI001E0EFC3F|nr:hypothetical protein [Kosmotoga sp.]MBO8166081.1 hypothetical protein [Kosmotoga sp.]
MRRKKIFLWTTAVVLILISALKITLPALKDETVKWMLFIKALKASIPSLRSFPL